MGRISMREEEMENAVGELDRCYVDGDAMAKSIQSKFAQIRNTGLLNSGLDTITSQINSITTSIFNVKNIIQKHSNEMFNMDRTMAKIAENIEVPRDFIKNNSMTTNTFDEYVLKKNDGKSVNEGTTTPDVVETDTDSVVKKEDLRNISKDSDFRKVTIDPGTIIRRGRLGSIVKPIKPLPPRDQIIIDDPIIRKEILRSMYNTQGVDQQVLSDATGITRKELEGVNNDRVLHTSEMNSAFANNIENVNLEKQANSNGSSENDKVIK